MIGNWAINSVNRNYELFIYFEDIFHLLKNEFAICFSMSNSCLLR